MRYASVCSGVEAASLAWMPLGWEAVFFAEIEPFPCAVLKERFPDVPNLGDMTEIKGEKYHGTVDLLVGGTPCQGFSVAGKQGGLNDSRSALCLAYCGLLETMRPRWFVWENVPGVFSTNQGDDFRAFLGKIDEIGYSVAWRVLDAQYVRVDGYPRAIPQRRRRVFVVGHLGDWRYPASVLFEPEILPGNTPPRRIKGAGVARSLTASTGGASGKEQQHTFISGDGRPLNALGVNGLVMDAEFWNGEDVSTTLTEAFADDRMPDKGKLPCVICRAGDMANAETGVNVGTTLLARQYKSPPFVYAHETGQGYWQDGDIAGALRAEGENRPSRPSNIICAGFSGGQGAKAGVICRATQQGNAESMTDCCPTITEAAGTSGNNQPIICAGFSGGQGAKAGGIGYEDEVAPTIRSAESGSNQVPDVICQYGDVAGTLTSRHDSSPCVDRGMNILCYANHAQDSRIKPCGECSPQINAKAVTGGCNLPLVQECFPINSMIIGKNVKVGDRQTTGIGNNGDPLPTISSAHHHAVAVAENIIGRKENTGANGTGAQVELAYTQNATGVMGVSVNTSVRRLLPVECERLMGFPEVDILEIGKMTKDEFIAWELASGNITVDFSTGKVFSCRTGGGTPCPPHELEGTILSGYKVVSLREKEVKKQCRVHRILWIAAHGIIQDGYVIDHINNDKLDNRLCNLQLLRPEENSTKAAKDGLYLTGEDHPKTKLTDEQKNDIITLYETEYYSVRRLAAMYGVSKSRIHQLVKRQGWTQIPWRGKSAEDCPDSPRYKACGNSMCVNVMRWIGMRIENVERRMKGIDNEYRP